jgi:hypothetical protein
MLGSQALGQQACKPTLAFEEVQFSEMQPPTLERNGLQSCPPMRASVRQHRILRESYL